MFRSFTVAVILVSCSSTSGWTQSSSTSAPAASTSANPTIKKAAPKAKTTAKQTIAAETGPCRLGVISTIGDQFGVYSFGLTIFETEVKDATVDTWGLDDIAIARVRAATGSDPAVRRIAYSRGAFERFYHPTSRFLPDASEGLPAIVKGITPSARCERYLVVTRSKDYVPGTKIIIEGIGAYSRGIGSILRRSHLFANIAVTLLDGNTYQPIHRPFAGLGTRLAEGLRLTESPLTKLDDQLLPEAVATVPGNATLRERTRALVAANLDAALPDYLKND
jgi:hypothetical protein